MAPAPMSMHFFTLLMSPVNFELLTMMGFLSLSPMYSVDKSIFMILCID